MGKPVAPPSPPVLSAIRSLGTLVQVARKRRRLTQQGLAERAGLTRLTISKVENGHPGLALSAFLEILLVLDPDMVTALVDAVATDPMGETLERQRLPQRIVDRDDF
jgi:transcriptional regulator with XRE-family HTH domain